MKMLDVIFMLIVVIFKYICLHMDWDEITNTL